MHIICIFCVTEAMLWALGLLACMSILALYTSRFPLLLPSYTKNVLGYIYFIKNILNRVNPGLRFGIGWSLYEVSFSCDEILDQINVSNISMMKNMYYNKSIDVILWREGLNDPTIERAESTCIKRVVFMCSNAHIWVQSNKTTKAFISCEFYYQIT